MRSASRRRLGTRLGDGRFVAALLIGLSLAFSSSSAWGVNIVMSFNSRLSDSPNFDPSGSLLTTLMGHVESYWEDIIEATGTLNINFYYEDLDDDMGVLADCMTLSTSGGKPTSAQIRVDWTSFGAEQLWYFDPTPTDNSEYTMQQTLVGDLTTTQKSDWYNGTPHNLAEVSYLGTAKSSAPYAAQYGFDLFAVMLHEMGHGLGMTGTVASSETADLDYDFDSNLVWGNLMAAECYSSDNRYHLAAEGSMMYPSVAPGQRELPSATDVFSIQTTCGWSDSGIDLPRKDYYSTSATATWSTSGNWEGNQAPGATDSASIRHGNDVSLSANASVANLLVDNNSDVLVGTRKLTVSNTTTVGTGTQYASISVLAAGGELETASLVVNNGASVLLNNGGLIDAATVEIRFGGLLKGTGAVDGNVLVQGRFEPGASAGTLTLTGDLTLDGGTVAVELGGLTPGTGFDRIQVAGEASLGGTLEVSLLGAFSPALGNAFEIMTFGSLVGNFDLYDGLDLGDLALRPSLTANSLTLLTGLTGDLNGDGFVGGDDLDIVRLHWGQAVSAGDWLWGDPSGDGLVGGDDLDIIRLHWGGGTPPPPMAVPEPSSTATLLTALVAGLVLFARRLLGWQKGTVPFSFRFAARKSGQSPVDPR